MNEHSFGKTPYYPNFQAMLDGLKERFGSEEAITCYSRRGDAKVYRYDDLYADVLALRDALAAEGLAGKQIAVAGENSYAWLVACLAVIVSGGVAVCIDVEQSDESIRGMIRQADCEAVFASNMLLPVVKSLSEGETPLPLFLLDRSVPPFLSWKSFCKEAEAKPADIHLDGNQPAVILYTSGTTVSSKPVVLSHKAVLTNVADALSMITPPKKAFASLPFYHAYGLTCSALVGLMGGLGICINGNLKTMMRELVSYRPGCLVAVPLMVENIHKMAWDEIEKSGRSEKICSALRRYRFFGRPAFLQRKLKALLKFERLKNLSLVVSGGAYLSKEVAEDLTDFGITVIQGYGITECSPLVTVNRGPDTETVGYPLPHMEVKIRDGEILVRGASLMNGYYNQPGLTEDAMEDGWFMTGDLGTLDKDGKLTITGRKKNLIVLKNGKKISAEEMEEHLEGVELIREVVAYGAVTGSSADDVKLSIMVYPDPELTAGMTSYEILDLLQREVDQLNAMLPVYKQIQLINLREQAFEKTSSNKIKRQII